MAAPRRTSPFRSLSGNNPGPMASLEELLTKVDSFPVHQGQPGAPRRRLTVLTCMDARIDPAALLGLNPGDAHVIRNAGGVATDDAIRSIAMSQRLLDTTAILVIQHTGCGIHVVEPETLKDSIAAETGERPAWEAPVEVTPEETLERTIRILRESPAIPHRDMIAGTVIDLVGSGDPAVASPQD